ncbi:MAG: 2-amino-4-hydroxy-6-hydroxymethyldihydropteridine diphosphokinase [Thermoleophilales bacterium]|nr:2-amino-4-hydroxy-6-hydroxymethyldihydropteridine diphosphokinase [Thermoleophilales bacterium]
MTTDPAPGKTEPAAVREVYLGLGSNIGDRFGYLREAIRRLEEKGLRVESVSSAWETEPVGEILDQPDFLNAAIRVRSELEPEVMLDLLKSVEADLGRETGRPRHSPRVIDIDLLLMGDLEYESDRLKLPHRETTSRRFVLAPLLELDPDLCLPDGTRLADAMAALETDLEGADEGQDIRRTGSLFEE